jgi:pimeloyl-ACP methyl ester carboxylesterase
VTIEPFTIDIPAARVDDLTRRLAATRWPDQIEGTGWDYGCDVAYLQDLVAYWSTEFDWWEQQARLNRLPQYVAQTSCGGLHFVHSSDDRSRSTPVVLIHGWPGALMQMLPLSSELQGHDVIVPSLPGFPFSERPRRPGVGVRAMAAAVHELMQALNYDRYLVHATDLGTLVAYELAHAQPESVVGVHVAAAMMPMVFAAPDDLSPDEEAFVERAHVWMLTEMAYALQHGTKPLTLAYGLNDSPTALAAWLVEKLRAWSDCGGDIETAFARDDLLTLLSAYWLTETGGCAIRLYYESVRDGGGHGSPGPRAPVIGPFTPSWSEVPVSVLTAPADMFPMPREWAERMVRVVRWTELERGGHFPQWEVPAVVADDIRDFAASLARVT